jgi:hypothetical protein
MTTRKGKVTAMRAIAVALVITLFAAGVADADPAARDALPGFNGIAFGTTFAAAKKILGAGAKADKDPSDPTIKTLLASGPFYGETFSVNYSFAAKGGFTAAYAVAHFPTGNQGACQTRWVAVLAHVEEAWGKPDANLNQLSAKVPMQQITYAFGDGSQLQVQLLGCLLTLDSLSPAAAK